MHAEALNAVRDMITTTIREGHLHKPTENAWRLAIDLGGADVNGTARGLFDADYTNWLGVDIAEGPGVDIVADARSWDWHSGRFLTSEARTHAHKRVDLVLCTELLEHVAPFPNDIADSGWKAVIGTACRMLRPGGVLMVTCASTGRRPHGARGELDVPTGEYYGNVELEPFSAAMESLDWRDWDVKYNPNPGDLYAWAVK